MTLLWSFATRSSQPITAAPSQITITSRPTAVPPPTGIGTSPTTSPSRLHIHGLYFDLPPGWCSLDNEDFITSLCPGGDDTGRPLVFVHFFLPETPPESARGAIADFNARTGGRVLESQYPPVTPTVDNQPVTIAYVEYPGYATRALIAVFKNGPQYHILSASLFFPNSPEEFQDLHDSVLGLLDGMSFDS